MRKHEMILYEIREEELRLDKEDKEITWEKMRLDGMRHNEVSLDNRREK